MGNINVAISVSTDEYGSKKLASFSLTAPTTGVADSYAQATPAQIDELEVQLGNRIAQVRRELASQIAAAREAAEKAVLAS